MIEIKGRGIQLALPEATTVIVIQGRAAPGLKTGENATKPAAPPVIEPEIIRRIAEKFRKSGSWDELVTGGDLKNFGSRVKNLNDNQYPHLEIAIKTVLGELPAEGRKMGSEASFIPELEAHLLELAEEIRTMPGPAKT